MWCDSSNNAPKSVVKRKVFFINFANHFYDNFFFTVYFSAIIRVI